MKMWVDRRNLSLQTGVFLSLKSLICEEFHLGELKYFDWWSERELDCHLSHTVWTDWGAYGESC